MGVAAGKADSRSLGVGGRGIRLPCLAKGDTHSPPPKPQLAAGCVNAFVLASNTGITTVNLSLSILKFRAFLLIKFQNYVVSYLTYLFKGELVLLFSAVLLSISVGISAMNSPFEFFSNVQALLFLS